MPDLNFDCPQCGQNIDADTSLRGMSVDCPGCGATLVIPEADSPAGEDEVSPAPETQVACASCGSVFDVTGRISAEAFECPVCQAPVRLTDAAETQPQPDYSAQLPSAARIPKKTRGRSPLGRILTVVIVCGVVALITIIAMLARTKWGTDFGKAESEPFSYTPPSKSKERLERLEALRKARDQALEEASRRSDMPNQAASPAKPETERMPDDVTPPDDPPAAQDPEPASPVEDPPAADKPSNDTPAESSAKPKTAPAAPSRFEIEPGPLEGPAYFQHLPKPPPFEGKSFRTVIRVLNPRRIKEMPELDIDEPSKRQLRQLFPEAGRDVWHFVSPTDDGFQIEVRQIPLYFGLSETGWGKLTPETLMKFWEICHRAKVVEKGAAPEPATPTQRTWMDDTGKHSRVATLVSTDLAASTVTLRNSDGIEQRVPLEKLSPDDRLFAVSEKMTQRDRVAAKKALQSQLDYCVWPAFGVGITPGLTGSAEVCPVPFHFLALKPPTEVCVPVVLVAPGATRYGPLRSVVRGRFTATVGDQCPSGAYFSKIPEGFLGNTPVEYRMIIEGLNRSAVTPVNPTRRITGRGTAYFVVLPQPRPDSFEQKRAAPVPVIALLRSGPGRKSPSASNSFDVPFASPPPAEPRR